MAFPSQKLQQVAICVWRRRFHMGQSSLSYNSRHVYMRNLCVSIRRGSSCSKSALSLQYFAVHIANNCSITNILIQNYCASHLLLGSVSFDVGLSFRGLQYYHRISAAAISDVIPDVCSAIYNALKDKYMHVRVIRHNYA